MREVAHGELTFEHLVRGQRGVTGSEQSLLLTAMSQAAAGHRVTVYLPTITQWVQGVECIDLRTAYPRLRRLDTADVVVSWLSADLLRYAPPTALRLHCLQINDWLMCTPDYQRHVDGYVAVSESHRAHLIGQPNHSPEDAWWSVVPNSVNFNDVKSGARVPYRCVYFSSPDRGLHWALSMWPEVRFAIPTAELHVYYEMGQWVESMRTIMAEVGQRAMYIQSVLPRLQTHGVVVHGAVPPQEIWGELASADAQMYPCDTVSYTEGFSVATLQACAAGVVPFITDADALGEIYQTSGAVLISRQSHGWPDQYLQTFIRTLLNREEMETRRATIQQFAKSFDHIQMERQWQDVIDEGLRRKSGA